MRTKKLMCQNFIRSTKKQKVKKVSVLRYSIDLKSMIKLGKLEDVRGTFDSTLKWI